LRELQDQLTLLASTDVGLRVSPRLTSLLNVDPTILSGGVLKHHEDRLDALFCAFLAWYCWRWGSARNDVFGNIETGYIVVPAAP